MALRPGDRLDHFEILTLIGKGGMGEVYQARDTRLNRDVAIKVSAERFSERFAREARVVASLNHPNICTLFDVGPNYLVMEFIEGESPKGPLPLETVLDYAGQMADALDSAHEKGVTHRDLKPANLKITPDGKLKILDFGLAKVAPARPESSAENSPTLTMGMTEIGMILGTAAYMAPEQAKGKQVDKRADIWAFGVVLYELSTGMRPFRGDDVSDVLASVLKDAPDFDTAPAALRPLLKRCLEKDPKKRLRDIADGMALIGDAPAAVSPSAPPRAARAAWITAGLFAAASAAVAFIHFREPAPAPPPVAQFEITPRAAGLNGFNPFAVSPDGRSIAYHDFTPEGRLQLRLRAVESAESRELAVLRDANPGEIFWSFDSRYLVYRDNFETLKLEVASGTKDRLLDGGFGNGGSWSEDGLLILGGAIGQGLQRSSAKGGAVSPLTTVDQAKGDNRDVLPQILPDGRHFLFRRMGNVERTGIWIASLDSPATATRLLLGTSALFAPAGYGRPPQLLSIRDSQLWSQTFDPDKLAVMDDAVRLGSGDHVSVSQTGVLAVQKNRGQSARPTWFDRKGKEIGRLPTESARTSIDLSPDGKLLAIGRVRGDGDQDLWLRDLTRGTETRATSAQGNDTIGIWSPDGSRIVFNSARAGAASLYQKVANGAVPEEPLLNVGHPVWANDWSRDGRFLIFMDAATALSQDLHVLPMDGPKDARKPIPYITDTASQKQAQFSPDGRFVAYASDESGKFEIYVRPFPDASAGKWAISSGGGVEPRWSRDGRELFYFSGTSLMAVDVKTAPVFTAGASRKLFDAPIQPGYSNDQHHWQVAPDGQRFLLLANTDENAMPITVTVNWPELLKK